MNATPLYFSVNSINVYVLVSREKQFQSYLGIWVKKDIKNLKWFQFNEPSFDDGIGKKKIQKITDYSIAIDSFFVFFRDKFL